MHRRIRGVGGDRPEPGLKYAALQRRVPFPPSPAALKHEGLWYGPDRGPTGYEVMRSETDRILMMTGSTHGSDHDGKSKMKS